MCNEAVPCPRVPEGRCAVGMPLAAFGRVSPFGYFYCMFLKASSGSDVSPYVM